MVQSDASIWCMGEAGRLADNNETIKIMATATKNLLFFVNRETFLNNSHQWALYPVACTAFKMKILARYPACLQRGR